MSKPKYKRSRTLFAPMGLAKSEASLIYSVIADQRRGKAAKLHGGELVENEVRYILPTEPRPRKRAKKGASKNEQKNRDV